LTNKIDRNLVHHLERLARIDLSPAEVDMITEQLGRIVGSWRSCRPPTSRDRTHRAMSHEATDRRARRRRRRR
jgi:Asp-tRNA(Asn)/Glu-tRNA(Gln) amidotransferase C subunit